MRRIVEKSLGLLETKCIRLDGHAPQWRSLLSSPTRPMSSSDFEKHVNDALTRSGLSHVAFFHGSGHRAPARYAINATFCQFRANDGPRWLFQDVHEGGPTHVAGVRPGDVLLEANGEDARPPAMPTFGLGQNHLLTVQDHQDHIREVRLVLPQVPPGKTTATPPMARPKSVVATSLEPGIGLVRVAFFPGVNGQRFAQELDRALTDLGDLTRLILDLRGNLGGFVGALRLMSYLTPDRLPIGYSLTRKGEARRWRPEQLACIDRLPATRFDTIAMALRFLVIHRDRSIRLATEGLGSKPFHRRIVMLINEHTLSAGEMVAAFAKENRLATIVGTRTSGQVLGGANFSVGQGFTLRFPAAAWYTWRGTVVEGQGVLPDVDVPLSTTALRRGRDNQLECATSVSLAM
jgi:C-terminal processing protease CtpA/Prc